MLFRTWLACCCRYPAPAVLSVRIFRRLRPRLPRSGSKPNNPSVDTRNQEYRDWWTVFHDPVLNRLIEIAYNQNLTLVSAGTRVLEARAQLGVAIGEFYPQLQQGNGAVDLYPAEPCRPDVDPAGGASEISGATRSASRSIGNWIFGASSAARIESADAAYLASIASYDYVLATLLGDVATTYIGIRTLQTQIEIARENIVKQKKALADRRGEVPRRHRDQARRLPGAKTSSGRPNRRSRS